MSTPPWRVLVVDDEDDVHDITTLALRRRTWRKRPIVLESARSAAEARAILAERTFHCALVDVVMETDDAGLRLCEHIRATAPRSMRIILRTGQPGAAPPEKVLQDYDIDHYLAKAEVTADRLFGVLRACFRTSLDIATLSVVSEQLSALGASLRDPAATSQSLVAPMNDCFRFLEDKHAVRITFVPDAAAPAGELPGAAGDVTRALGEAASAGGLVDADAFGLPGALVAGIKSATGARGDRGVSERVKRWLTTIFTDDDEREIVSGVVVVPEEALSPSVREELRQDLGVLLANWRLADESLRLQGKLARERLEVASQFGPRG